MEDKIQKTSAADDVGTSTLSAIEVIFLLYILTKFSSGNVVQIACNP
jgi:hypothetical protein